MGRGTLVLLAIGILVRSAHAEPEEPKSPTMATALAVGGTVAPAAFALTSYLIASSMPGTQNGVPETLAWVGAGLLVLGPSAGNWYSGTIFTTGLGLRVAGGAVAGFGIFTYEYCKGEQSDCKPTIAIVGLLAFGAGVALDVVSARQEARAWNARRMKVAPTVMPGVVGQRPAFGLALGSAF